MLFDNEANYWADENRDGTENGFIVVRTLEKTEPQKSDTMGVDGAENRVWCPFSDIIGRPLLWAFELEKPRLKILMTAKDITTCLVFIA